MMTPEDYVLQFKEKFGTQSSKDGQLIRDMNDFEVLDRALKRYPGDRARIDEGALEAYYNTYDPTRKPPPAPPKTGVAKRLDELTGGITEAFKARSQGMEQALSKSIDNEQGIGSGFLQAVGEGAGFIGDVGFEAVKAVTPEFIKEGVGQAVEAVAEQPIVQDTMAAYGDFKEKNPELTENLEAVGNIATVIPGVGAGAKGVKEGAKAVARTAKAGMEVAEDVAKNIPTPSMPFRPDLGKEAMETVVIGPQGKKKTIAGLEKSGMPGGYAPDESFLGKLAGADKYVPTARDYEVAESVKGIVRKSNTPSKNIENINNKIAETSETVVRPALRANPMPFNVATYANRLKAIEMPDFIKSDEALARTYNIVRDRFVEVAKRHPKTKEGLWDARKEIDQVIEQQFGAAGFNPDKYSALQKAILDMRRATNDFIAEGVPDNAFQTGMRDMSNMYSARHNIALDNYAIQNKDWLTKFAANNPKKWAALKAAGLAGTLGGGAMFLSD
jgi:hypothetical protein